MAGSYRTMRMPGWSAKALHDGHVVGVCPAGRTARSNVASLSGVAVATISAVLICTGIAAAQGPASSPAVATQPAGAPQGARVTSEGWFAPVEAQMPAPPLGDEVDVAFVIPIKGPITETTYRAVKRKVVRARAAGAQLVIFELNTPGGESGAMKDLLRLILDELRSVHTVAYVNPEAISAGAVISLACNEIAMSPTAIIGDAMPIMVGAGGQLVPIPKAERGKIESYFRGQVRTLAKQNGYNVELCEAMVTLTMEIWLIRNSRTQELRIVSADDWRSKVAGEPTAEPTTAPSAMAAAGNGWQYVRTLDGPGELVTLTADEAVFAGIAAHTFPAMHDLQEHYNITVAPQRLADSWSERMVGFLTSPAVAGILMFVGVLCLYVEINSPGFGVPGTIAIIAFAILFGSRFLIDLAQWWEIAIFAVGLILLALEVFVIPGFGVAGVLGIVFMLVGLLATLIPNAPGTFPWPATDMDWSLLSDGTIALVIGFACAVIAAAVVAQYLPKIPIANRLFLRPAEHVEEPPVSESSPMQRIEVGAVGTVESMCRPAGTVRFGDDLLSASSEGQIIEPGTAVRVIRKEGNRLLVEVVQEA